MGEDLLPARKRFQTWLPVQTFSISKTTGRQRLGSVVYVSPVGFACILLSAKPFLHELCKGLSVFQLETKKCGAASCFFGGGALRLQRHAPCNQSGSDFGCVQPQPPNAVASFHRRAGYLFYLNRAFQVQWHYELVRQQEKVVDDGIRSVKREGSEEAQNDSSDGRKDLHQSNEDDEEDKKDFVMQDVETPCEDDRSSPALASSSSRVGTPAMASSSSRIISKATPPADGSKLMNLNFLLDH
mmetsp:Transcript_42977/g.101050  ORF Transcript_42977/g.101050 Transcript_42977/m.101050 type:complete len:242 (+) Transcript_42977:492-1217(+)